MINPTRSVDEPKLVFRMSVGVYISVMRNERSQEHLWVYGMTEDEKWSRWDDEKLAEWKRVVITE